MRNGIWSTEREQTRGGADARGFDLARATSGHWRNAEYSLPLTNGREYSEEEIWDNWAEWIRQVAAKEPEKLRAYAAWLLSSAKGYGMKLVNPGGVEVWKEGHGRGSLKRHVATHRRRPATLRDPISLRA